MFNNEVPFTFNKMQEFSTVDGFVELNECIAEMIKYVANEPSVGLFYIQQHVQNAAPNLINAKNNIVEKSRDIVLHTEDLEDSVTMVKSMKECGFPIADEMIRDVKKSLAIMSKKQPKRGLIHTAASGFQVGRTYLWNPTAWGRNAGLTQQDGETSGNYLSSVIRSARQRASNFRWPRIDPSELKQVKSDLLLSHPDQSLPIAASGITSTMPAPDAEELRPSSHIEDETRETESSVDGSLPDNPILLLSDTYDEVRAHREAKLEEWLERTGKWDRHSEGTHE